MRRRGGLALLSLGLALGLSTVAEAKAKQAVEPYKVLVVTSTQDAVSTAGIAAITSAVGADGVVTAPAPADVGAQFTPTNLDSYRSVVFLNTGLASPLTDAQRANFEAYHKKGGGFVGIGSAVETDESWAYLTSLLGTRSTGKTTSQTATVKVFDRVHDATKNLPEYWERTESFYNFDADPVAAGAQSVRGLSHVLATVVEKPFEPQPAGNVLKGIEGGTNGANHPISFCKDIEGGRAFYTGLGTSAAIPIWNCRAQAFDRLGTLDAVASCGQPNYPPLLSLLLALGAKDPLFGGRLLPLLALAFFALLLRVRLARVDERAAAPALLFLLATVQVWQGEAMTYADVPLMAFLCGGVLLTFDAPRSVPRGWIELGSGLLCLAAAALVRPDGLYYAGVAALAAVSAAPPGRRLRALAPYAAAALAAALWLFASRVPRGGRELLCARDRGVATVDSRPVVAALLTFVTFLDGAQGQWLAHKGLGAFFYALLVLTAVRVRRLRGGLDGEGLIYERVTWGALAAVAFCYAADAVVGEPVVATAQAHASYLERDTASSGSAWGA